MKDLTWKHVAIALGFLACVTGLAIAHADTSATVLVGMAVLGGLGWVGQKAAENVATTTAVKEQTNGNMSKLLQMVEAQGKLLAAAPPVTTDKPSDDYTVNISGPPGMVSPMMGDFPSTPTAPAAGPAKE